MDLFSEEFLGLNEEENLEIKPVRPNTCCLSSG